MTEHGVERHSGLPAEVSSLVGRGPQLAAVLDGLRAARVVTLTGPGGCGKTRLALRAATLAADGFGDGARLVELAFLADPALVPASVAEALGVPERDAANPVADIVRALADRELLIVLDNCEHVLGSAGRVVVMLAGQCPRVRILATSRERLDVPGEFVFPVPPLGLPEDGSAGAVAASEAGDLFVARARAASPGFTLTGGNAAAIAEVCARLDGMPLAIELAAARARRSDLRSLPPGWRAIPGLLTGGAARPGRHRSLEALVSWSYELLGDAERRLLARLSVLRGGFDLDVAERVAGGEPLAPHAVAGLLASLAGKSLVQVQAGPVIRYSLLETVRQFAAGQLAASGEETAVQGRLLRWALEVAQSADAALSTAEWTGWSDRLAAEQANIRAALSWALGGAEPEAGRELAARLARWWIATGRYSEAGQFLTTAAGVPAAAAPGIQARVLLGAAWSAYHLGDNPRAAPLAADGIACARQAGEPQLEVLGPQPAGGPGLARGRCGPDRRRSRRQPGSIRPGRSGARGAGRDPAGQRGLPGGRPGRARAALPARDRARPHGGGPGRARPRADRLGRCPRSPERASSPPPWPRWTRPRTVTAAHPDRFTETAMRHWRAELFATLGQLEAAETGGRAVLGRGAKRRRPAGGIPRSAGRGPPRRRQGRYRRRYWRASPGRRRRAPRRDRHSSCRNPGRPGVHGRHRR